MMNCFDGQNTLALEKRDTNLTVFLIGTQVHPQGLAFIQSKLPLKASASDIYSFEVTYDIPSHSKSLSTLLLETKSEIERLTLAVKLKRLLTQESGYTVPFVHPENIFLIDDCFTFIHSGLKDNLSPMTSDPELLLSQYKALVLCLLSPKLSYDQVVGGDISLKDANSQAISASEDFETLHRTVSEKLAKLKQKEAKNHIKVAKVRYHIFKYTGIIGLLLGIVMGSFMTIDRRFTIPKKAAIISAQADFITKHYDKSLNDLKAYQPKELPKNARFILASSAIQLADLTVSQKQAVLNNISVVTDDNTLNYWIYQGRGEFEKALDMAKNIGDDQLTLLAYTDLYQATKLNTTMNGDTKQKKLETYNKQIQELSKSLGK